MTSLRPINDYDAHAECVYDYIPDEKFSGIHESYYKNGQLRYRGRFDKFVKREGLHVLFEDNGMIREVTTWKDGWRYGPQIEFDADLGYLKSVTTFGAVGDRSGCRVKFMFDRHGNCVLQSLELPGGRVRERVNIRWAEKHFVQIDSSAECYRNSLIKEDGLPSVTGVPQVMREDFGFRTFFDIATATKSPRKTVQQQLVYFSSDGALRFVCGSYGNVISAFGAIFDEYGAPELSVFFRRDSIQWDTLEIQYQDGTANVKVKSLANHIDVSMCDEKVSNYLFNWIVG